MMWRPIETADDQKDMRLIGKVGQPGDLIYVIGEIYFDDGMQRWIWSIDRWPYPPPDSWCQMPSASTPTTPLLARMAEALKAASEFGLHFNPDIPDDRAIWRAAENKINEVLAEYAAMTGENGDG